MRPLDPRLLTHARATRGYVVATTATGVAAAGLTVASAMLVADVLTRGTKDLDDVATPLIALAAVLLGRALVTAARERLGRRAASVVIGQLRARLVARASGTGRVPGDPARLATLATVGLEGLEGYLTVYLPQLLLTATVTPLLLVVVWWQDALSGLLLVITLPLVPLFMALVGLATRDAADRRLAGLQRLGAQVLDLLTGLPTLRALGREHGQAARVRAVSESYRRATMRTLRTAFLSALVLETLTTLCVALVAVSVGLRLVHGDLDLRTGLVVLILAPEVHLPLRLVGSAYHASVDGLAAVEATFAVLDAPVVPRGTRPAPSPRGATITLSGVTVTHDGADRATPAPVTASLRPGRVTALAGPSGSGKSTLVAVLLGLLPPTAGQVLIGDTDLAEVEPASWWRQIAWVPQQPTLTPGPLEEVAGGRPKELEAMVATLPDGWATRIGHGGHGLSAGQRQRVALARALASDAPLVVLDEPTAHLDAGTETAVHDVVARLREEGRTVVLVAHRPSLLALADDVVEVSASAPGFVVPELEARR